MNRGDVVIVDFPFVTGAAGKKRPALVVQNDRDNRRMTQTIIAMITGNLRRRGEPTQLVVDPSTPEGASSGLHKISVVNCSVLYTIEQSDVITVVGRLSPLLMRQVNDCLKSALEIP